MFKFRSISAALLVTAFGFGAMSSGAAAATPDNSKPHVDTTKPHPVVYPIESQRQGEEGSVVLRVYVLPDGKTHKIEVAKSSGYDDLDNGAIETALNWSYVPAMKDGETVSDWAMVKIDYKLPEAASDDTGK